MQSSLRRRVLVVGATGNLGRLVVKSLVRDDLTDVVALSRRAPPTSDSSVRWVQGDMLQPASLTQALANVDTVISTANGYMKESIEADYLGNKNLVDAIASSPHVTRFVFLSITGCDHAPDVPHFHAKAVTEALVKATSIPYVFIRASAFLDQSPDWVADNVPKGRYLSIGDTTTPWSYTLSDDLADNLATAAATSDDAIANQTIDIGWQDGPKTNAQIQALVEQATNTKLTNVTVPWWILSTFKYPTKLLHALAYDIITMLLFFRTGKFVADTTNQARFLGPVPTSEEAVRRWAKKNHLGNH
ncbi:hypothetical protein DYB37_007599 [Aphanomyces astaci]|uniref:NmrA-like domain-containing protein n=3 Tax=Aphanomyces astaci TaxID=112090 RepID=A0A397CED5_APHAT|nr:hypothetical protein DYB25_003687 [Aphanomyces astaci]RHY44980.1 hypothetical protein DYB38_003531 [Aphanomyces astaci]RHY62557.1 hypothetical protein DYB34_004905 [Aphanomyces astaci]RHY78938.1 hypothetical protein DYB30_006156 [Aphanomyces astaci]RHY92213.1 hypothetical protein DYB35_006312 [Aphanomyces astaci]